MATTVSRAFAGALTVGVAASTLLAVPPGRAAPAAGFIATARSSQATRAAAVELDAVDYRPVVETLKREIPLLLAETKVVGTTVALVDGDRVVMARGFGWADRAKRRPVTARTLFHIGSLSKTFTAASVMQLVEQGRVDLDAPLTTYVPELRLLPRFPGNRITVRSVLDHHSGIPGDVFDGMITLARPDRGFHAWLLRVLRRMPPERRVNSGWAYNNSGYVLLQLLVEHVTGEPFAERTARTLFGRMGMRSSTFDDSHAPSRTLTRNYAPVLDGLGRPTGQIATGPREYVNGWTAGSILSSAKDMTKYLRMLVHRGAAPNGRVLRVRTFARMTVPQTDLAIDLGMQVGLSWFLGDGWTGRTFGHDGATTRNFSMLTVHPDQRLAVFVSTNTVGGSALADAIATRALELAYMAKTGIPKPDPVQPPDPVWREPTDAELARAQGWYSGYTDVIRIQAQDRHLVMTTYATGPPTSEDFRATADGWWSTDSQPYVQIGFRTVAGRRLLVTRSAGDTKVQVSALGERVRVGVPRAWRRAAGEYRVRLDAPHATDLVHRELHLRIRDGIAVLEFGLPYALERHALQPFDGRRAFTFGWSAVGGRRQGDLVRLDARTITYMGIRYRRVR